MLDIAEASFNSIIDILTTLKTNATQAANDTLGSEERDFIQSQVTSLLNELDSLVEQTVFQGNALLSGDFNATFQVGERTADTINVQINQGGNGFRSGDLSIDSLSVTSQGSAAAAIDSIDTAITSVSTVVNQVGIYQTQLSIREEILTQSINSNNAARSRIRDADFAREQSESIKLQILQQTAITALAQANVAPQAVLGFIS